jgi:hypothetical protein
MIHLFDIQNGKIVPTKHCEAMETLQVIKRNYPQDYLKIYLYFFYMSCYDSSENPYFNIEEIDKENLIMKQIKGTFLTDNEDIREGLKFVQKLYETPMVRAYLSMKVFIDKWSHLVYNANLSTGKEGNAQELFSMISKFDSIKVPYQGVLKDLLAEQKGNARGNAHVPYDQK